MMTISTSTSNISGDMQFPIQGWRAEADRFENERDKFNFRTLTFAADSRSTETATAPDTASTIESDFDTKLDIDHSQRLVRRSAAAASSLRSSAISANSFNKNSSSSNNIRLDQLAISQVSVVGRDADVTKLIDLYKNPNIKMVTITGESGSGKSILAQELYPHVTEEDKGFFCKGKFDVQNRANPYQAISEAIDELIRKIVVVRDQDNFQAIRNAVKEGLGDEGSILSQLIPAYTLFDEESSSIDNTKLKGNNQLSPAYSDSEDESSAERSITERAMRIQNVFVSFIRCVSSQVPTLVLLLDDIQWAGPASMAMVEALLNDNNIENVFLVATCRSAYLESAPKEDGISSSDSRGIANPSSSTYKVEVNGELQALLLKHNNMMSTIKMQGLGTDSVQDIINVLFRLDQSPRTRGLAEIVQHKTGGNPYFVLEFMRALVDEELVLYDTNTMGWMWYDHEIKSRNVSDNVAEVVASRLLKLNKEDLLVAQLAACLARSFHCDTILFILVGVQSLFEIEWEDMDWPRDIDETLQILVGKGILERQSEKSKFSFAHDQLQQAAFSLIPKPQRIPLQLAIGKRLIEGLDSFHREEFLFTAVDLCAKGLNDMKPNERKHFAFWAFLAGEAALKQGAFQAAIKFLDYGISAIGNNPFEDDPELSLPLFSGAAEAAYCVTDMDKAKQYVEVVSVQKGIHPFEKIRVVRVLMKIQCGTREFQQAATTYRKLIKDLGAGKIPKSPGTLATIYQVLKTANMLKKYEKQSLTDLPMCSDPSYTAALNAEASIGASLYVANPNLFVISSCLAVQWSLKYGISKSSPTAFVSVAMVLISLNDYKKALELAETAIAWCEMHQFKEQIALTVALVFGFVRHWTKPMQQFVAPLRYGIEVGTRMGCMDHVAIAMNTQSCLLILTSISTLPESIHEIQGYVNIMRGNHDDQGSFTRINLQFAVKLANPNESVKSLDGDIMKEAEMRQIATKNKDVVLDAFLNYFRMQLFLMFANPIKAAEAGKKVVDFGFKYGQGTYLVPRCMYMIGLANALCCKQNGKTGHLRTTRAMLSRLNNWALKGNPNVFHFIKQLEAELCVATKKLEDAKRKYSEAITSSKRMGYSLDFAFFNELFALFLRDYCMDEWKAIDHMGQAVGSYERYGALNKVEHLKRTYPELTVKVKEWAPEDS